MKPRSFGDRCGWMPPKRETRRGWAQELARIFPDLTQLLPEAKLGDVEIKHCRLTREECLHGWIHHRYRNYPGPYTQLNIGGIGWMHDTLEERIKNYDIVQRAAGDVLIGGLGLGMILHPILRKPEVRSVRVLENNPNVAALVLPSLRDVPGAEKLLVTMTDAATWEPEPGERFDTIWLDCIAFYAIHARFIQIVERWLDRFQPWLREGGYLGHWAFAECVRGLLDPHVVPLDLPPAALDPGSEAFHAEALALAPAP